MVYTLEKNGQCFDLYYEVDNDYADYFCDEIADGVVVSILSYAMRGGYDIISDVPMSEDLYYKLTQQLIPMYMQGSKGVYETKIRCRQLRTNYSPSEVATAMSCGVDSLAAFYENTVDCELEDYKVTLLTYFENGAHHGGTIGHDEHEQKTFESQLLHVKRFCEKIGYPLLVIRSNLDFILSQIFWSDSYQATHSFRNAGFVLLMQKLIRTYYYAPAHDITHFECTLVNGDSSTSESVLLPNISTSATRLFNSSTKKSRIKKIRYIAEYPETHDSLLVCYKAGENCGECYKCTRTLVELDVLGELDNFHNSFNLESYRKHRNTYFYRIYKKRRRDPLYHEICEYAKAHHVDVPLGSIICGTLVESVALVIEKANSLSAAAKHFFER